MHKNTKSDGNAFRARYFFGCLTLLICPPFGCWHTYKRGADTFAITIFQACVSFSARIYRTGLLAAGRPQGRNLQHWLEAEAQPAAIPQMTIKTEMTVKNEVGGTAKTNTSYNLLTSAN